MSSSAVGYRHPALEAVAAIGGGLDGLAGASLWSMPVAEVGELVVTLERLGRRLCAAQIGALAQADAGQVARQTGATSTVAWLRSVADVPGRVGKARLGLHRALANRLVTSAAFGAGDISVDAATAVCAAIDALPGGVPAALTTDIEVLLVDTARGEGTRSVVRRAAEITHRFGPEVLEAHERVARERRWLLLTHAHDGTLAIRGRLDAEAGALVSAVLAPLAAPAPATDGTPDMRDVGLRYADALIHACQVASAQLPEVRGEPPTMLVTVGLETLENRVGSAPGYLDTGFPISAGTARKRACDANVIPILLASTGQPLDVGRATRSIPPAIRRALIARDQGCAFPGCDRPPSWCEAHHRIHWADGGPTSICNLCLLCGRHHDAVHHDGWSITMIDDRPWFIPPPWIDPTQIPRQNSRYRVRELDP
jgi:hypothetical protein